MMRSIPLSENERSFLPKSTKITNCSMPTGAIAKDSNLWMGFAILAVGVIMQHMKLKLLKGGVMVECLFLAKH